MDAGQALELAREQSGNHQLQLSDLRQDPGALDTWFSSWLWPCDFVVDSPSLQQTETVPYLVAEIATALHKLVVVD